MNKKNLNMRIRLPRDENCFNEKIATFTLFHCGICGVHENAYMICEAVGNDEDKMIKILEIFPGKFTIKEVIGSLPCSSELNESLFCGKCGFSGSWTDVPEMVLEENGIEIFYDEYEDEEDVEEDVQDTIDVINNSLTESGCK